MYNRHVVELVIHLFIECQALCGVRELVREIVPEVCSRRGG